MASVARIQARCAENIALMTLIGGVSAASAAPERVIPTTQLPPSSLKLSPRAEEDLVSTLAFLSGIQDDASKVTAVCVHETQGRFRVLVAEHAREAGRCHSPQLQRVKAGFDAIFDVLGRLSTGAASHAHVERQAFASIVRLCRDRILSRTRLRATGEQPSMQSQLEASLARLDGLGSARSRRQYRKGVVELIQAMDRFHVHGGEAADEALEGLVDGFSRLYGIEGLAEMLAGRRLLNDIGKIAQYRTSAARLVDIARAWPVVQRASTVVVVVVEQPAAVERVDSLERMDSLEQTLDRLAWGDGAKVRVGELCQRLNKPLGCVNRLYEAAARDAATRARVHAEVQLVAYLDACEGSAPRFIASNKDACRLCDAFVAFHGRYTLVRAGRGRACPRWRLPVTLAAETQQRFNEAMQRALTERVSSMMMQPPTPSSPTTSLASSARGSTDSDPRSIEERPEAVAGCRASGLIQILHAGVDDDGHSDLVDDGHMMPWQDVSRGKTKCGFRSDQLQIYVEYNSAAERRPGPLYFRIQRDDAGQGDEGGGDEGDGALVSYDVGEASVPREIPWSRESNCFKLRVGGQCFSIELDSINSGVTLDL